MNLRVPYLKWRNGRPRWEPGPRLRERGWKGRDLKAESGAWLPLDQAIQAAQDLNADVAVWRAGGGQRRRPPAPRKTARTCQHLYELWSSDDNPDFTLLAANTRVDYTSKIGVFLDAFGDAPVASLGPAALKGFWRRVYRERGHAMANAVMRVARAMLSDAVAREWRADNPAFKLKLKGTAPRQVLWLPAEVAAGVAAADALGLASIGDYIVTALHSGQRQSDVLDLPVRLFDETRIRLSQFKTRARIDAPMTPALLDRVAAIKTRRWTGATVVDFGQPIILREDGARYDRYSLGKAFRRVRAKAAETAPGILDKTLQDLRDTSVTRLALADCTLPEIAAITGHSLVSITRIMRHYLVLQPAMADAAIAKLTAWMTRERIAL